MNTREIATEYRLSHWAQIMRERVDSGLSIKAFCANAGFHENVYFYWQRKLREATCEQLAEVRTKQMELTAPGFTEVKFPEATVQSSEPEATGCLRVEASGVQITADSTYPIDKLAVLLRELTRSC